MPRNTSLSPNDFRSPRMVRERPRGDVSEPRCTTRACSTKFAGSTSSASGEIKRTACCMMSSVFLEGRMPGQRQPFQRARGAVGELAKQGVDQDREHNDIDQHELA